MPDGSTVRQNLESVARQTGRRPEGLDGPELPPAGYQIWDWFMELNTTRQVGMGLSPITYSDMQAFFAMTGERPARWQIAAIRRLDAVVLKAAADSAAKRNKA